MVQVLAPARTVLLHEPDPGLREMLAEALAAHGYAVEPCPSLVDAWGAVSAGRGDVALVDYAARKVRGHYGEDRPHLALLASLIPLILVVDDRETVVLHDNTPAAPFEAVLDRPFALAALLEAVERGAARSTWRRACVLSRTPSAP